GIRDFHVTGVQTCALPISEQVRGGRVAGDDRRDMRAVAVGVARRDELVRVEIVTREKAVDVIARADDLVVARARRKTFAFLTDAAEAFRRVVLERRARALAVRPAEPQAGPRRRRPTALADARNVTLDVEQRGMVRRDAAVDEADDDILAPKPQVRAQAPGRILEAEEDRAVERRELPVRVRPDALDGAAASEL